MTIHDWTTRTRAQDIMVRDLVTVLPSHNLAQVATVFLREQISGVPVVGSDDVCLGVITIRDVIQAEEKVAGEQLRLAHLNFFNSDLALPENVYNERLAEVRDKLVPASDRPVKEFMTTNMVTVHEDTSLAQIVASMVDAHVHRLLVLDEKDCLCGVVSTIDVLAALMRASQDVGATSG